MSILYFLQSEIISLNREPTPNGICQSSLLMEPGKTLDGNVKCDERLGSFTFEPVHSPAPVPMPEKLEK